MGKEEEGACPRHQGCILPRGKADLPDHVIYPMGDDRRGEVEVTGDGSTRVLHNKSEIIPVRLVDITSDGCKKCGIHHVRVAHQYLSPSLEGDSWYIWSSAWSEHHINDVGNYRIRQCVWDDVGNPLVVGCWHWRGYFCRSDQSISAGYGGGGNL